MDCSLASPLSMEFSRQEYWSGLPFPSPGNLPEPGSILGLLHCRQSLYQLRYWRSPKKTKRETKDLGMETCPGEGVMKEEQFPNSRKLSHCQVCLVFWNLRRQHNQEEKNKKTKTENMPNRNSQWRSSPDTLICHQQAEAGPGRHRLHV